LFLFERGFTNQNSFAGNFSRSNTNIPTIPYELPEGITVEMGTDRFKIPELMFVPDGIQVSKF
jgi:hypothetical protein